MESCLCKDASLQIQHHIISDAWLCPAQRSLPQLWEPQYPPHLPSHICWGLPRIPSVSLCNMVRSELAIQGHGGMGPGPAHRMTGSSDSRAQGDGSGECPPMPRPLSIHRFGIIFNTPWPHGSALSSLPKPSARHLEMSSALLLSHLSALGEILS